MSATKVPVPCSREDIRALYDTRFHVLIVSAKGEAPNWMLGVRIEQQTIMGGLKFALLSSAGGLGPAGNKPFEVELKVPMNLPNRVVMGKDIIFVTENKPHGFLVPIKYTGLNLPIDISVDGTVAPLPGSVLPPIPIVVPGEGKVFTIHAAADIGPLGVVNIDYDNKPLKLINASIQGTDIVWTFLSLALGKTLVEVTSEYMTPLALNPFAKIQGYLVEVVVLGDTAAKETTA